MSDMKKNKKGLTKYRCVSTPILRQALGRSNLLCADSLSTNFLLMKADCYYSFTDRAFDFNNTFITRICIKQSLILAARTCYMYFLCQSLSPPFSDHNSMEIWRKNLSLFFYLVVVLLHHLSSKKYDVSLVE